MDLKAQSSLQIGIAHRKEENTSLKQVQAGVIKRHALLLTKLRREVKFTNHQQLLTANLMAMK